MTLRPYRSYSTSRVEPLPPLPTSWSVVPLKAAVRANSEVLAESTPPDFELSYVDIGNVDSVGGITGHETVLFRNAPSRARRLVRPGDVIVSTVRTYLRASARISNPAENLVVSTGFAVLRPGEEMHSAYLGWIVQSEPFVSAVVARSTGISYPSITSTELLRVPVPMPKAAEQGAVSRFLDRQTAKIDALIAEQERLIALLQEKRQALISHAVTRGLDPNVPMKDSGFEWIGAIPAHWRLPPVADRYFVELGKMLDEKRVTGAHLTPYLRNINVQWDEVRMEDLPEMDIAPHENERYLVRDGDLLVCEGGEVGRAAIWDGRFSPCGYQKALHRLRARRSTELPRFMLYTLRHGVTLGVFTANGNQNTIPHLTAQQLRRYRFPTPPVEEQRRIVEYLDRSTEALRTAEAAAQEAVSLLRERRTALITAAVTGQIDVRGLMETAA